MSVTVYYLVFENADRPGHMDVETTIEGVTDRDLRALQILCCGAFEQNEYGHTVVKDKAILLKEIKNGSSELKMEYMVDVDYGKPVTFEEFEVDFDKYHANILMERAVDNLSRELSNIYFGTAEYVPDGWTKDDGAYKSKKIVAGSIFAYKVNPELVPSNSI